MRYDEKLKDIEQDIFLKILYILAERVLKGAGNQSRQRCGINWGREVSRSLLELSLYLLCNQINLKVDSSKAKA